ncbi:hypothetical protein MFIFM68171_10102 [Madurella fahalii]|uniref:Transmembrane protein n=1 Tax=Madurella fahalii TaxID=1157608 RepID=A0ABQ0GQ85_9PEZI
MANPQITPALGARQGRVLTQTITRPTTTIIAVVTLGDGPTSAPAAPTNLPTTTTPPLGPVSPGPPSSITQQQLAIILGTVLGFAFLVVLIFCYWSARWRRGATIYVEDDEYSESDMVEAEELRRAATWNRVHGATTTEAWTTVPPPVRFPPTPRYTPYRQTPHRQYRGVWLYP